MSDKIAEWREFSKHMEKYIVERTMQKYESGGFDLLDFTDVKTCFWNILRYAIRNWNGEGKEHDIEKIAHYDQVAWTKQNKDRKNNNENG